MTTNKVIELNPSVIKIGERFRKSLPDLDSLCESIQTHGQLQPIGVYKDKNGDFCLLYGHRRLEACKRLGLPVKAIELAPPKDVLSEKVLEFIENSVRQDFSPVEKAASVKELHKQLKEKDKNWTVEKTAKLLGLSRKYVHDLLRVAGAVELGELDKEKVKGLSMKQLRSMTSSKERLNKIMTSVMKQAVSSETGRKLRFLHGDAFKFEDLGVPSAHFDIVLTDPPYGIDAFIQSASSKGDAFLRESKFDDSPDKAGEDFVKSLWSLFDKLLNENGMVICFCSYEQFLLHKLWSKAFGFNVFYSRPMVWIKASAGQPFQGNYMPSACTEFFLYASRGKHVNIMKPAAPDWISVPRLQSKDRIHPTQKPVELFKQLLQRFAFPHFKLIDPFAGSGSALKAGFEYGLPEVWGIEYNEATYRKARVFLGLEKEV